MYNIKIIRALGVYCLLCIHGNFMFQFSFLPPAPTNCFHLTSYSSIDSFRSSLKQFELTFFTSLCSWFEARRI